MFDIHSHILPEVDDGSSSLSLSLEMLKVAKEDGISHILLTPHAINLPEFYVDKQKLSERFKQFLLETKHLGINLYLGSEIYCTEQFFTEWDKGMYLSLNNSKFILIEFSLFDEMDNLSEFIYTITTRGLKPIVAHPERYTYITLNHIINMKKMGALIQLNALSLFGNHGRKAKKMARVLLKNELVDFIASDAHDLHKRPPKLKVAKEFVAKKYGTKQADKIFDANPKRLLSTITKQ